MLSCGKCNGSLLDDAKFCHHCGSPAGADTGKAQSSAPSQPPAGNGAAAARVEFVFHFHGMADPASMAAMGASMPFPGMMPQGMPGQQMPRLPQAYPAPPAGGDHGQPPIQSHYYQPQQPAQPQYQQPAQPQYQQPAQPQYQQPAPEHQNYAAPQPPHVAPAVHQPPPRPAVQPPPVEQHKAEERPPAPTIEQPAATEQPSAPLFGQPSTPSFGRPSAPSFGQPPMPSFEQSAATEQQPAPTFEQPAVAEQQPAPAFEQPAVAEQQPAPAFEQPAMAEQQPTPAFEQPAMAEQQPAPAFEQPAAAEQQPQDQPFDMAAEAEPLTVIPEPTLYMPELTPEEETIVRRVKEIMPPQPWPSGTFGEVAKALGVRLGDVAHAVDLLIRQRVFLPQIEGIIFDLRTPLETES